MILNYVMTLDFCTFDNVEICDVYIFNIVHCLCFRVVLYIFSSSFPSSSFSTLFYIFVILYIIFFIFLFLLLRPEPHRCVFKNFIMEIETWKLRVVCNLQSNKHSEIMYTEAKHTRLQ